MPERNTARAIITKYTRERDRARPSGWAYRGEPVGVLLDDLAWRMPAGEIVPVAIGKHGKVTLALRDAVDVIESCTYPGAATWRPTQETPRGPEAVQRYSTSCHGPSSPEPRPSSRWCEICNVPLRPNNYSGRCWQHPPADAEEV
jgi:hypothetical protein